MYTIYADGELFYSPVMTDEFPVVDISLVMEISKAGSCEFTVRPNHPKYKQLKKRKSVITVYQDNDILWRGQVRNVRYDFQKNEVVSCEGQLANLCDSVIRPYQFTGTLRQYLSKLINEHNAQVDSFKQFSLGTVTVETDTQSIYRATSDYPNTWDEIQSKLLSELDGYILPSYNANGTTVINYLKEPVNLCSQTIEFGKNMVDLENHIEADDVITVLIPTGKKEPEVDANGNTTSTEEVLDIKSVNNGKDYIESSSGINLFGRIVGRHHFDWITNASSLKSKGQQFLSSCISTKTTIEVKAFDLHLIDASIERIKLGWFHEIISSPHDLDVNMNCSKITLRLDDIDSSECIFGKVKDTGTARQRLYNEGLRQGLLINIANINDRLTASENATKAKIGTLDSGETILSQAQKNATQLIKQGVMGGYVFSSANEIIIADSQDLASANNVWRWNQNGLGFSSTGYNGTFETAITSDGKIVADMITTGKLLAEYLGLYGKMEVYKSNQVKDSTNIGGYIGYFTGSTGGRPTTGIQMEAGGNRIAVSSSGASMDAGTPIMSLPSRGQCGGDFRVTGNCSCASISIDGIGDLATYLQNL